MRKFFSRPAYYAPRTGAPCAISRGFSSLLQNGAPCAKIRRIMRNFPRLQVFSLEPAHRTPKSYAPAQMPETA
ncbi:hypothetical protein A2U01_0057046 [Trifolium medium]|uniref:Uncharacterized protein n=1 Tax=Trifolium medium TaxID=97028 RepID=A0A392RJN9_9FABA|nr:hypothetical protein [Trifolium medium]